MESRGSAEPNNHSHLCRTINRNGYMPHAMARAGGELCSLLLWGELRLHRLDAGGADMSTKSDFVIILGVT